MFLKGIDKIKRVWFDWEEKGELGSWKLDVRSGKLKLDGHPLQE